MPILASHHYINEYLLATSTCSLPIILEVNMNLYYDYSLLIFSILTRIMSSNATMLNFNVKYDASLLLLKSLYIFVPNKLKLKIKLSLVNYATQIANDKHK